MRAKGTRLRSIPGACSSVPSRYRAHRGQWPDGAPIVGRSPDDSKIKQKMLFASSKDALRRSLVGIAVEIQGTDYSEVAYESGMCKAPPTAWLIVSDVFLFSTVLDKVSRGA